MAYVRALYSLLVAVAIAAAASCTGGTPSVQKLAAVAALPKPSLPPWIASISPTRTAQTLAQIRVIFAKPVTPVEALSGEGPRDVLDRISIEPDLAGHFVVLTPRMIGFVAERALPVGTRVRITLAAGLHDLSGDALTQDLSWTFDTQALSFTGLPQLTAADDEATPAAVSLQPKLQVTTNAAVDAASLASHAQLNGADGSTTGVTAVLEATPSPSPGDNAQELYDPSLNDWVYDLRPAQQLRRGTTYRLAIAPGVEPIYGNLPTTNRFLGGVRTYDVLAIVPTPAPSPNGGGRFADGDPAIAFSNTLDPDSIANAVTISPAPAAVTALTSVSDQSNTIAINPYALDPDKTYVATVAAGVKDVFGQTLGHEARVTIHTSDFAPGAWAPSGYQPSVIPAGASVDLNFYATNLPGDAYRTGYARLTPLQMLGSRDPLTLLPPWRSWPSVALPNTRRNVQSVVRFPLQSRLGASYGALAYGFRTDLDAPNADPSLVGSVQLTNLGVFSQWFPAHGLVLVQRLSDGAPVLGAAVTAYRVDDQNKLAPQPCASGATDANGELNFYGVDVERCSILASSNSAPNLGVVVTQGADVATVTTWSYSGFPRFDIYGGWTSGAPLSRGTIFSDRQMYQPGERGELTGAAYYVKDNRVVPDANALYTVSLSDPSNVKTSLGRRRTDSLGIFSMPIDFSKQQALGDYSIAAKGTNGNEIDGSLRVAEFKPPNFNLTLTLGSTWAAAGSSIGANVSANYLFGAPLEGGTAHAYVTRDVATVQPKGWDDFWFGPQWFYPEQTPSFTTDVLQRDLTLDAKGMTSLAVAVPADLPFPMTYTVDMETSDVSNLSVSDSQTFLALPGDAVIGLASDTVGKAGTPMPVRVILTDGDGKALAGRSVHLELQKMTYTSATQEEEGGENAQQAITYATVASADVVSGDHPVTAQLTPSDAGSYRVIATPAVLRQAQDDKRNAASATEIQVFAFGAGEADWGLTDPNAVAIKLDKKQYAIGETANALIASPYDRADIYIAVVRNDTLYRTTMHNVSGTVRFPFKITSDMMPNAALEAVVVRRGGAAPTTLSLTGMAAFNVDLADRYLKLAIAPHSASVQPGGAQSVDFALTGRTGAPVRGEIVAMVVNDAILQLTGYRLPDLVQTVFAQQPIATIFADNRENVTLKTQTAPLEKGFGYGGGFLSGAGSTRVRTNFLPLAYYGVLPTGTDGRAHAQFTMPDDLTTWRVMAVALDGDAAHFVTADHTFISTQPLIANPLLPQFARPGDRFALGLSLANQTGASGALDLVLKLTGALAFAQGDPHAQRASETAQTGIQAFRFPVVAGTPAPTSFEASSALGGQRDAFKVPFTTSDRTVTESVIESGVSTGNAAIPIDVSAGGSLQLTLANSIVPQFVVPSERVMTDDVLPLADESASRLIVASALARLRGPYRLELKFDPTAAVATNLQGLLSYQNGDGGFGTFTGDSASNPFTTAGALDALLFARAHGVRVADGVVSQGVGFMTQALANPGRFKWCNVTLCKAQLRFEALWTLAQAGHQRTDFLSDVVAQADQFDSATQIRLARYLLKTPGWQGQGATMADRLQQTLYITGRYSVANLGARWSWLGSLVDAQSQMLQLLIERRAPAEQIDGAVRALVAQQCRCGWPTTDDTASALTALSAYAAIEQLTPSTATAMVGDRTVVSVKFGRTASSQTITVDGSSLKGKSVIIEGKAHYILLYTYPVPPDAPGQLAAFRIIRTVNEPSVATTPASAPALATMDLLAAATPLEVPAGRVFDIAVRTIVDHPVDRIVIEDPLPAGFEAVDTSFRTTLQAIVPQSDSWQIDATQMYRDRVVAYAQHLDPGVYDVHYLVRSVTPGTFRWPGARAYLQDAPEQFGRSASSTLEVRP
jgi:hypothetical protein